MVEKLMSSFKLIRILLLQWLFAYCFSGAADSGWGRVLRTPTSPFALKGECHKLRKKSRKSQPELVSETAVNENRPDRQQVSQ